MDYFYNKKAAKCLDKLRCEERPDIAHVHLIWGGLTPSILTVLKNHRVPIVHTAHDYRLICPSYLYLNGMGNICDACGKSSYFMCLFYLCSGRKFLQSFVMCAEMYFRNIIFNPLKMFDGFIFLSDFSKNKHYQYLPNLNKKSVLVVGNPVIADMKENNDMKENYFIYFGRIAREKGVLNLIRVMKRLPDLMLKVVGEGPLKDIYHNYVEDQGLMNIKFIGYKKGEPLYSLIKRARFSVLPSICHENYPMAILESYYMYTPVICSNIGGIPEMVQDGRTGYLFEPRDEDDLYTKIQVALSLSAADYSTMCSNAYSLANCMGNEHKYYNKLIKFYLSVNTKTLVLAPRNEG
jgi:glycosyltransferase involved in cell wall biosynthesis